MTTRATIIQTLNGYADENKGFWLCGLAREVAPALSDEDMDSLNDYARMTVEHYRGEN